MHPILDQFLDRWVWPTMPGAPGAEFRLRLTREKCLKGWEISLQRTLGEIEEELGRNDEAWKKERALRGYAAEGVHMSIKQMSRSEERRVGKEWRMAGGRRQRRKKLKETK